VTKTHSVYRGKNVSAPEVPTVSEQVYRALPLASRAVWKMLEADGEARIIPADELPASPGKNGGQRA